MFSHLLRLPMAWFEKRQLGDVISRAGATQAIQRTLTTSFFEAIVDGLMATLTVAMMVVYDWRLAAIALCTLGLYATVLAFVFPRLRESTEQGLIRNARANTHLIETVRGIQAVRLNGAEGIRLAQLENFLVDATRSDLAVQRLRVFTSTANLALFGFERVVVVWIGALAVLGGALSLGMLVAYLAYKELFTRRAIGLVDKWQELRMLRLHVLRLADITCTEAEGKGSATRAAFPADSSIELIDVSFRYSESDPWVVNRCSFRIEDGECVALTGASGCGKSTLAKLLVGLLAPTSGTIKLGGVSVSDISGDHLRKHVAAVMQDDHLFSGSIADNIREPLNKSLELWSD